MNVFAVTFGATFPEGVKRYRRKLVIDLQFFLNFRAASAFPCPIPAATPEGHDVFARLQSAGVQEMVDCAYRLASLDDEGLESIRSDCCEQAPDLLHVIDALVWLAREELAEPKLAVRGSVI